MTTPSSFCHAALLLTAIFLLSACGKKATIPADAVAIADTVDIFPDYRNVVIPPNIAPLNFMVRSEGDAFVCAIRSRADGSNEVVTAAQADGKMFIDSVAWRQLLDTSRGHDLSVTVYAKRANGWVSFPPYTISVAEEPIDAYLSYRLIEPSYELYRQMGLYQRCIENFDQQPIYENNRTFDLDNNHCVNCHNYQAYGTDRMLFHVRSKHGGTVIVDHGAIRKVNMKCDSILSSTVYPSWHPTRNWVVFSSNKTGQVFHIINREKIEVMDHASDLVFFDADNNTLTNILKSNDHFETFPCWSPDGKRIFYCDSYRPDFASLTDDQANAYVTAHARDIRYDIYSLSFDEQTRRFGEPRLEVGCVKDSLSASVPRVSPDGHYLLFTLGQFGQFHIWHRSSDLWVKDLQTGDIRPLTAANSPSCDSYHTWSSNGRWIVFASRRLDDNFSRPFIAYFDRQGQAHKAFLLPQYDPEQNTLLMKSYNVPELTRERVKVTPEQLRAAIYDDNSAEPVSYRSQRR